MQGHAVTVVGFGDHWIRELPAVSGDAVVDEPRKNKESERMKIAWRYERLGDFGSGIGGSRGMLCFIIMFHYFTLHRASLRFADMIWGY